MKTLTLLLVTCFFSILSYAQGSFTSPDMSAKPNFLLSTERAQYASAQTLNSQFDLSLARGEREAGKCEKYKKMKLAGIIVASVGGGLLITGIALEAIATGDVYNNGGNEGDIGLVAGGAVCIVFGIAGAGAGIPLAIIGSVKAKRYCNGNGGGIRDRAYMQLSTKGNGLALNF